MQMSSEPIPKMVGVITIVALLILILVRRGFGGVTVSVGS